MKRTRKILLAATMFGIVFAGCSQGSTPSPTTTTTASEHTMSATIGSTPWKSDSCTFSKYNGGINDSEYQINGWSGNASSPTGTSLEIFLTGYHGVGTYSVSNSIANVYLTSAGMPRTLFPNSGSVIITSISPSIVGTFSFTGSDTVVSNGTFNALIQ